MDSTQENQFYENDVFGEIENTISPNTLNEINLDEFLASLISNTSAGVSQEEITLDENDEYDVEQIMNDYHMIEDLTYDKMTTGDLIQTCQSAIRIIRMLELTGHKLAIANEDLSTRLSDTISDNIFLNEENRVLKTDLNQAIDEINDIVDDRNNYYDISYRQEQQLLERSEEIDRLNEAKLIIENKLIEHETNKGNTDVIISELASSIKKKNNLIKKLNKRVNKLTAQNNAGVNQKRTIQYPQGTTIDQLLFEMMFN